MASDSTRGKADPAALSIGPTQGYRVQASHEIYNGRVVRLRIDEVEMPGGQTAKREVAGHPGGVGVIAIDDNDRVCMITQYRHPLQQRLLEVPAGLRDIDGEDPEVTAARELEEEAAVRPAHVEHLCSIAVSPGFTDEIVEIYLAQQLQEVASQARDDEEAEIEIHWIELETALQLIDDGTIIHGIAVAGIQAAWRRISRSR